MSKAFEALTNVDRVVHEPARLAILTALQGCAEADFLFLQQLTGLTKGNLSSHLMRLEAAGLVEVIKEFVRKTPRTRVRLSHEGRRTIDRYWKELDRLRGEARRWKPGAAVATAVTSKR
jgi:DNA-binding transcriptional ArsR family regulator